MRILVTGGAGFVGRHLVSRLLAEGHEVVVLDNFYNSKKSDVPKGAKIIEADIRDAEDVKRAVHGCSAVFHLAAIAEALSKDDNLVYNVNFLGSKNVFEAAKAAKAKIIFTSSAAVYGESRGAKETDEPKPVNQYGKSKLKAEKICPADSFIVRLFNIYGPDGHGVVNKFTSLISRYKEIVVYGHGTQTRDFVYVEDAVNALQLGLLKNSGIYNVGTGKETSLTQLIELVHKTTKCTPDVVFTNAAEGDVQRSKADISKIKNIGWSPEVDMETGIIKILNHIGFDFSVLDKLKK
jgi:UDP-glucose 4-epimerase